MASTRQVILFGDLTLPFEGDLKLILRIKDKACVRDFLDRVTFMLRGEVQALPQSRQDWLPRFTTLQDLLENNIDIIGAPAIRFTLLCIYQIAECLRLLENGDLLFPIASDTHILGLCTGSFATAALSASQHAQDLVIHGITAVRIAFRTALRSLDVQRSIHDIQTPKSGSWSTIVSMSIEDATTMVEEFCIVQPGRSVLSRPYISAVGLHNVTISGPTDAVSDLIGSRGIKHVELPIESPYHAPHLFTNHDVDRILDPLGNRTADTHLQRIPILSPVTGLSELSGNFLDVLRRAVSDTLCEPIRWDKVATKCGDSILGSTAVDWCTITPVATNATSLLSAALSSRTKVRVTKTSPINASHNATSSSSTGRFEDSKIAVVGYSGRFPEADSNEKLWQLLMEGRDTHRTIPSDRFDWEAHFDPTGKRRNTSKVKYGCFINEPGLFDARFFQLSPKEAEDTDPAQRLALMSTYEALEMAGFVPDRTPSSQRDRVGVFFGVTSDDWREVNSGQSVGTYFIPGGNRAFVPGRISYFFRFSGPSISVDTACSSSFAALNTACLNLWQGNCDTAIAGGVNVLTNPDNFAGLDRGHFLSTTGNCNPFDNDASGYCRADAVGSVIIKRLEDAVADGDPIFGVIAGVHTNHCGQTVSITRPHEGDQLSLFKRMMRHSGVDPIEVSYVEMHGTGTQHGDAAEMKSVLTAFEKGFGRTSNQPLHLGAVKGNIGHSEAASGVTALIKVLMMMQHDTIPPHIGIKNRINQSYPPDLKDRHVIISTKATKWHKSPAPGGRRISFLNNFSAAGGNTAVLLADYPTTQREMDVSDLRPLHPVAISAKSLHSLKENMAAMIDYLGANPDTSLPALSYTTTARRSHHQYRAIISERTTALIRSTLQRKMGDADTISTVQPIPQAKNLPKVVFTFTGQGALYSGIGKELFESVDTFRNDVIQFDSMARQLGLPSFLSFVTSRGGEVALETVDTVVAHLALVCVQMALSNLWLSWGILPSLVTGHSLGEYAAFFAAGVLTASDTIYLAGKRAQLLLTHCTKNTHAMVAVKAALSLIKDEIAGAKLDVACVNSPVDTVLSGTATDIETISETLRSRGIGCIKLDMPYAFHSSQVHPILDDFEQIAQKVVFREPTIPILSPLLAKVVSHDGDLDASYLPRACRNTVDFQGAVDAARTAGVVGSKTIWLEIGAHPICTSFVTKIMGQAITMPSLRQGTNPWQIVTSNLEKLYSSGFQISWNEFHRPFAATQHVVPLPRYSWDLKNYWIMYKNNFCLTKGSEIKQPEHAAPQVSAPISISSSVQRIVSIDNGDDFSSLVIESDIQSPQLDPLLQGHMVNGVALTSSSIYADIVNTMAKYMLKCNNKWNEKVGLDCRDMKVLRPLVSAPASSSQLLQVSAAADWNLKMIKFSIWSVDGQKRKLAEHASCVIHISLIDPWMEEWQRNSYLIQGRIAKLKRNVDVGNTHKLKRGLVYKLFGSLVDYTDRYQGMQEVVLDSEMLEATAQVVFQCGAEGFEQNPCWTDSLGSIAGFIMNGNDNVTSKNTVFINHGWQSMRCARPFELGKTYQTYNRMQLQSGTLYAGDTYILDDGVIIACFGGIRFQGVPRSVLENLLPPEVRTSRENPRGSDRIPLHTTVTAPQKPNESHVSSESTLSDSDSDEKEDDTDASSIDEKAGNSTTEVLALIRATIASEAGAPLAEITPTTSFSELGVDSLLSLTILGSLKELGFNLSPGLFAECDTLQEVENALAPSVSSTPVVVKAHRSRSPPPLTLTGPPHATSTCLSQPSNGSSSTKILFLFPDGAGSSTSYANLPPIPSTTVYGLNCPWLRQPQDMNCSLEQYVSKLLVEVRKRQPSGPYSFGGWSAGGILAYQAMQQVSTEGEYVSKLLLIDSPDPIGLENPPQRMYDFLESLNMFGSQGKQAPKWLRPHFDAFLKMLDGYKVQNFLTGKPPKTHILYARDGLCKNPGDPRPVMRDDDPREMRWLINNRTDFSGGGWRTLLGTSHLSITVLDEVNHYTILEGARGLGKAVADAVLDD